METSKTTVWTEARIRGYGVQMPSADAAQAVFGCGKTSAYAAVRSGKDLGFRVLPFGRRYVTPTADVLSILGITGVPLPRAEAQP